MAFLIGWKQYHTLRKNMQWKGGILERFIKDFKKFITRGNIVELAIAVIIGTAFSKVVSSLLNDAIMPVVSLMTGKEGFENYKYVITEADPEAGILEMPSTMASSSRFQSTSSLWRLSSS